jgi:hypothetical protein
MISEAVLKTKVLLRFIVFLVAVLTCTHPAFSQACALCHTQAASETPRFIAALKEGIWILILPSLFICSALASMAYRRRDRFHDSDAGDDVW